MVLWFRLCKDMENVRKHKIYLHFFRLLRLYVAINNNVSITEAEPFERGMICLDDPNVTVSSIKKCNFWRKKGTEKKRFFSGERGKIPLSLMEKLVSLQPLPKVT